MSKRSFEEILEHDGVLIYTNVGDSMLPLIRQGRDLLVIRKLSGKPRKYNVVLYKRDNGQYVLHRIIKRRKQNYVMCGDNRFVKEYGITDRHIIGILTSVIRDGKEISLSSRGVRFYSCLWCGLFPIRSLLLRFRYACRRVKMLGRYDKWGLHER